MKNKWIKLLNRKAAMQFSIDLVISNRELLLQEVGYGINNFWYDSITDAVYYLESEIVGGLGRAIVDKITDDPGFINRNIKDCYKRGDDLLATSEAIKNDDVSSYSRDKLFDTLKNFRDKYLHFLPYATYPHSIERYIIGSIRKELEPMLCKANKSGESEDIYQILTTPTRLDMDQQIDVYKAAYDVQKNKSKLSSSAIALQEKYGWMPLWATTAEPLKKEYYEKEILSLSKQDVDFPREIIKLTNNEIELKKRLKNTLNEIHASKLLQDYVFFLQEYIYLRTYRKNILSKSHYNILPLLEEIGKRTKIGNTVLYMGFEELLDLLQDKSLDLKEIKKREEGYAVYARNGKLEIITNKKRIMRLLKNISAEVKSSAKKPTFVRGRVASRGNVTGRACVVLSIKEIGKVKKRMILVTNMTTPDFTPVLGKISAIVTNEGGVTCHAAIVSREFKIPCIVGTSNATELFKDGDMLEVDAENGICKKIT